MRNNGSRDGFLLDVSQSRADREGRLGVEDLGGDLETGSEAVFVKAIVGPSASKRYASRILDGGELRLCLDALRKGKIPRLSMRDMWIKSSTTYRATVHWVIVLVPAHHFIIIHREGRIQGDEDRSMSFLRQMLQRVHVVCPGPEVIND